MAKLRGLLAINGAVFLVRAYLNIARPTSFYLQGDAPKYAIDAVRIVGIAYATLGLIQLGTSVTSEREALRTVAAASMVFAAVHRRGPRSRVSRPPGAREGSGAAAGRRSGLTPMES
jgi:hypothetical protein